MTNQEKLNEINDKLDNWGELSLLEHFDLILCQLPEASYSAKFRPNDEWRGQREESDFEKGLLDHTDIENNK